jgi:hypothetical protein
MNGDFVPDCAVGISALFGGAAKREVWYADFIKPSVNVFLHFTS